MWIRQVICDGFKSYAHRTVIGPFDREFNAITGLNGSGKSNILDSICFVFAISNLQKVRVRDLRELIYKSGQAGITKASVTIDFDNTGDPKPIGYNTETITVTRQVITGGRNKFFINGKTAQLSQVQNLFHSVQLNVNNPHFLIMQGTITKVLNMKPAETLSMLEEAAGTRMFEMKKTTAQAQIAKKDLKLQEIDRQIAEDIAPTLKKLEEERKEYDRFIQQQAEIEKLSRLRLAYDFEHAKELVDKGGAEADKAREKAEAFRNEAEAAEQTVATLQKELETLKGGQCQALADAVADAQRDHDECKKNVVRSQADVKNMEKESEQIEIDFKKLTGEKKSAEDNINNHKSNVQKTRDDSSALEKEYRETETQVEKYTQQLQLLKSGIIAGDDGVSLAEKLDTLKKEQIKCESSVKLGEHSLKQTVGQLEKNRAKARATDTDYAKLKKQFDGESAQLQKAEAEVAKASGGYNPEREREVSRLVREAAGQIRKLEQDCSRFETVIRAKIDIEYKNGLPPDMASKVKGRLARLITIDDDKYCVPLGEVGKATLQQVVVDNEQTGKRLIGEVARRVTIIPLTKIIASRTSAQVCDRAKNIASARGGEATLALELVNYDPEIEKAVMFGFGRAFVCSDLDTATSVAFDKGVLTKCVTMDGETAQPGGVMSGGSTRDLDKTLLHIKTWRDKCAQLEALKKEKRALDAEQKKLADSQGKWQERQDALEDKRRLVDDLKYRVENNQQYRIKAEIAELEQTQKETETQLMDGRELNKKLTRDIEDVQREIKMSTGSSESKKKEVEAQIVRAKQKEKDMQKRVEERRRKVADADAEEAELRQELDRIIGDLTQLDVKRAKGVESIKAKNHEQEELEKTLVEKTQLMTKAKNTLDRASQDIKMKETELSSKLERKSELEAEINRLELKVKDIENDVRNRKRRVEDLEKSDFVRQNRAKFGVKGSDLDWRSIDYHKEFARLDSLKSNQLRQAKTVNQKVLTMFEAVESQYQDVLKKREQVAKDKKQVLKTIEELEEQKKKTITDTYEKVTVDFSSIFGTLLPGANAKLHADVNTNTQQIVGISIKVAMGKVWKEGLTELSGGQRSLLALSLILSLLKYKPAPVYILDEVDAALDLSHTQNIGKMLKNHFRNSQFLVVSLKEGMFNNANVLFRVRLMDGQSQVARHTCSSEQGPQDGNLAKKAPPQSPKRGSGMKRGRGEDAPGSVSAP